MAATSHLREGAICPSPIGPQRARIPRNHRISEDHLDGQEGQDAEEAEADQAEGGGKGKVARSPGGGPPPAPPMRAPAPGGGGSPPPPLPRRIAGLAVPQ